MRFRAHSLTHGARAFSMEGIGMQGIRRKLGARHECKIAYSWSGLGATAALLAAVPGAHSCGQRPAEKGARTMRFRAHSLTHGARAIVMEGIGMQRIRPKTGARHECRTAYSWPAVSDIEGRARQPSYVFEQPVRVVRGPENTKPDASSFASFAAQKSNRRRGQHGCGQHPAGTARGTMRFRAHSLTRDYSPARSWRRRSAG